MSRPVSKSAVRPKAAARPSVSELSGRSYAVFSAGGMRVDLQAYFSSPEGRADLARLSSKKKR